MENEKSIMYFVDYDEMIDRSRRRRRKCFYECSDKETVVVTTSIGYPCQNSITEKRKP